MIKNGYISTAAGIFIAAAQAVAGDHASGASAAPATAKQANEHETLILDFAEKATSDSGRDPDFHRLFAQPPTLDLFASPTPTVSFFTPMTPTDGLFVPPASGAIDSAPAAGEIDDRKPHYRPLFKPQL